MPAGPPAVLPFRWDVLNADASLPSAAYAETLLGSDLIEHQHTLFVVCAQVAMDRSNFALQWEALNVANHTFA